MLPFADRVKNETLKITNQWNTGLIFYCRLLSLSPELTAEIDSFFISKGLGKTLGVSSIFKRHNTEKDPNLCHYDLVDYTSDEIFNASFVIPCEGGKGGGQYWFTGENTMTKFRDEKGDYAKILWHEEPKFLDYVEIHECPMVVKLNIPHNAFSSKDGYRTVTTIRLVGNPSFEEICRKLSN